MNFIKKVRDLIADSDTGGTFGAVNAASQKQQAGFISAMKLIENPGRLALGKVISSEVARLVALEFSSEIVGSKRAEFLSCQYKRLTQRIREITQTCAAYGGVVLKPYVSPRGIDVTCVTPDMFIPTQISPEGQITAGAFLDKIIKGNDTFTRVEIHCFSGGEYVIENKCYRKDRFGATQKEIPLFSVDEWKNIKPMVSVRGLKKPLFAYFKIPAGMDSLPLGESVFANAISLIADAEAQYERLLWEYESGERALYIDDAAIRKEDGKNALPEKRLYRMVNQENLFEAWTPEIRDQALLNGLDEIFRRIEFNTGLAYGTLSRVSQSDKTAEEIRASKQRSYARICEIQGALKNALLDLIEAMNALCDLYSLAPEGEYSVNFEFDDSIVTDRNREFSERMALLEGKVINEEEMRDWYFGKVRK